MKLAIQITTIIIGFELLMTGKNEWNAKTSAGLIMIFMGLLSLF